MASTNITGSQILDGTVGRDDLDITTVGGAAITKVIAGTNVTLSYTGADPGTGDVTVNFTGSGTGTPHGGVDSLEIKDSIGSLKITGSETNAAQTETNLANITVTQTETNAVPVETSTAKIAQAGETNPTQTETRQATITAGATSSAFTGGWVTPANAQAFNNATYATLSGSTLAGNAGVLTLSYTNLTSSLTISSVKLYFYVQESPATLSTASMTLKYQTTNIAVTTLILNGTGHAFGTPVIFDITTAVAGNWANLNGLQTICDGTVGSAAVGASTDYVDAVVLQVIAS